MYLPEGGIVTLNLYSSSGRFNQEWFLPQVNQSFPGAQPLHGGDYVATTAPYTGDAVLYLSQQYNNFVTWPVIPIR